MTTNIKVIKKECTGCGACFNICPVNAISMQENNEGFLYPVIDENKCTNCGLCAKRCPILSERKNSNKKDPECYAVMATDEIRSMSSSGGMFTLLADYILEQGGYICGAAYNNDWSVSHIIVDNKKDLSKLRGSKYLQSNTEKCYTEIKKLLNSNKKVLFTGCPCQVAGLYGYLGRDYDNLLTMELLCHGTPSYKTFKKYLDETFPEEDIERIEFRDKSLNWCSTSLTIYHDDSRKSVMNIKDDPYEKGFHRGLFNRESCAPCKFARLPRQADFTVADWWGIEKIKPEYDDKKGTSLVLTNNSKAQNIFSEIATNMKKVCQIPLEDAKKSVNVTIYRPLKHNVGREKFFKALDNTSIQKNVETSLSSKYDVGIIGLWKGNNYGCILTGYALYHLVQELGYSVAFIDKINHKPKKHPLNMVERFIQNVNIVGIDKKDTCKLNNYFSQFLVGSDQVWNYQLCLRHNKFYLLDFAHENKKKIAYASSFGDCFNLKNHNEEKQICKYLYKKFDNISVRENYATNILKEEFDINSIQVLDPVFVCDKNTYYELGNKSSVKTPENYIFAYILDPNDEKNKILEYVAKKLNKKLIVSIDAHNNTKKRKLITHGQVVSEINLEDWLNYYKNASYIVTDSFHGTCFSIIFEKQFISIGNYKRGIKRFNSLTELFKLEKRVFKDLDELINTNILHTAIDYSIVNKIIEKEKEVSKQWLINSLKTEKCNELTDYDMTRKLIAIYSKPKIYYKLNLIKYHILSEITFNKNRIENRRKKQYWKEKVREYNRYSTFI